MKAELNTRQRLAISLMPLFAFAWRLLIVLTVSRIALVAWQWQRVSDAGMFESVFLQGLRFDLVLLGIMLALPVLCFPILASNRFLVPAWRILTRLYFPIALLAILFMELSTPSFVQQFDFRPNRLFVEYLDQPKEIGATLWVAYKIPLMFAVLLVSAFTFLNLRQFSRMAARVQSIGLLPAIVATSVLLVLCTGLVRSTTDHRPVNPSIVALSNDPLVNDLALSSMYTVMYAILEAGEERNGGFRYAAMDKAEVIEQIRDSMSVDSKDFSDDSLPTLHHQVLAGSSGKYKNLVIVVEESLGAEFVGSLGGLDLTPNLDELAAQGIWFANMYATGTRSVRGLEAIVSGFTPTPARSVVKLSKSQRNFFTLAQLLGDFGYESCFIYGGESQFDNMRRFFMNNGFDWVIDEGDYESPVFTGSWGVSDEDLFNRTHEELSAARDTPIFTLVFTSSNHSPFQFPDGRIELYDEEKNTVNNAVKYADHALGTFISNARRSDYWDDTVFLIVADHNSRVYGADVVPIDRFHIPALILGGSIEPAVFNPVASQIDLAPTLLALIGIAGEHPMIGHDLMLPESQLGTGRAIMQFRGAQAYMEGDRVAVLQKDLPVRQFWHFEGQLLAEEAVDDNLAQRALAHSVWSSMAYDEGLFRLR